ncbi:MAG: hypothetical protein AAF738_00995 [Bacteroidota bacterium]
MNYLDQICEWSSQDRQTIQDTIAIDSTRIRIPTSDCSFISNWITSDIIEVLEDTGEPIRRRRQKSISDRFEGITTRYQVKNLRVGNSCNTFLTIGISSKLAKEDYFNGISCNNLEPIYKEIQSQGFASFSFDSFRRANTNDTDYKIDFIPNQNPVKMVKAFYDNAPLVKDSRRGVSHYLRQDNCGIQYGLRETTLTKYPFLKFYEKLRELFFSSDEFYRTHLKPIQQGSHLMRAETTIKSKKHYKILGADDTSLFNVVNQSKEIASNAFQRAFDGHLPNSIEFPVETDFELGVTDKVHLLLLRKSMKLGLSLENSIEDILSQCCLDKQQRYRLRNRLTKLCAFL